VRGSRWSGLRIRGESVVKKSGRMLNSVERYSSRGRGEVADVELMAKVIPTTLELRALEQYRIGGWYSLNPKDARLVASFLNRLADEKESAQ